MQFRLLNYSLTRRTVWNIVFCAPAQYSAANEIAREKVCVTWPSNHFAARVLRCGTPKLNDRKKRPESGAVIRRGISISNHTVFVSKCVYFSGIASFAYICLVGLRTGVLVGQASTLSLSTRSRTQAYMCIPRCSYLSQINLSPPNEMKLVRHLHIYFPLTHTSQLILSQRWRRRWRWRRQRQIPHYKHPLRRHPHSQCEQV